MISGAKWMLMCRSGPCSSEAMVRRITGREARRRVRRPASPALRRRRRALQEAARPPRPAGARRGARGRGRGAPAARPGVRLAAGPRRPPDVLRGDGALARGPEDVRARPLLRHRGPGRAGAALRPPAVVRAPHAAPPARPGRPARTALPRPQDPRGRAVPSLTVGPIYELRAAVEAAVAALADGGGPASAPTLERPKKAEFGDYSTNAAMLLAPILKAAPRDVAGRLGEELSQRVAAVDRVEVAGPGFLNLWLADGWFRDA